MDKKQARKERRQKRKKNSEKRKNAKKQKKKGPKTGADRGTFSRNEFEMMKRLKSSNIDKLKNCFSQL